MSVTDMADDMKPMLNTGRYEILICNKTGEQYIFPKTTPKPIDLREIYHTNSRPIGNIDDWISINMPPNFVYGPARWSPTDNFILHMKQDISPYDPYSNYIGRFSYHPDTEEFLPSRISIPHQSCILGYGNSPFNEYIRGIYFRKQKHILIRPYFNPLDKEGNFNPYGFYDPEIDNLKTWQTLEMLAKNGLPDETKITIKANNDLVKKMTHFV